VRPATVSAQPSQPMHGSTPRRHFSIQLAIEHKVHYRT
jgi:hypothetical protein